jgi:hypothetical protein
MRISTRNINVAPDSRSEENIPHFRIFPFRFFSMNGENYGIPAFLEHIPSFIILDN